MPLDVKRKYYFKDEIKEEQIVKGIALGAISQSQKDISSVLALQEVPRTIKSMEAERRGWLQVARVGEEMGSFHFTRKKNSQNRLHNDVNALGASELHT